MPKLVFHAKDPDYAPKNNADVVDALREVGLIAERWAAPESVSGERYLIGDSFLSLVTFMGCAPAIELLPLENDPASTEFCHIEIGETHTQAKFIAGSDNVISRCPQCRQRHANWTLIPSSLVYACDKCKVESSLFLYDWKNTAGYGRFFISLHGIYPQEAIPTDSLLNTLEKISDSAWNYFYVH